METSLLCLQDVPFHHGDFNEKMKDERDRYEQMMNMYDQVGGKKKSRQAMLKPRSKPVGHSARISAAISEQRNAGKCIAGCGKPAGIPYRYYLGYCEDHRAQLSQSEVATRTLVNPQLYRNF